MVFEDMNYELTAPRKVSHDTLFAAINYEAYRAGVYSLEIKLSLSYYS